MKRVYFFFALVVLMTIGSLQGCDADNQTVIGPDVVDPPTESKIVAIVTPRESAGNYTDSDHEVDTVVPTAGGPVKYWELLGDSPGNDFDRDGSQVVRQVFNTIRIRVSIDGEVKTISVNPSDLVGIMLEHVGGDMDYVGHGPWVLVRTTLEISQDGRVLYMRNEITMTETKEDNTRGNLPERYRYMALYEVSGNDASTHMVEFDDEIVEIDRMGNLIDRVIK